MDSKAFALVTASQEPPKQGSYLKYGTFYLTVAWGKDLFEQKIQNLETYTGKLMIKKIIDTQLPVVIIQEWVLDDVPPKGGVIEKD
ncbi:MAG: hypothetical protein ACJAVK_001889 [Akkermansiaceae bacterium]